MGYAFDGLQASLDSIGTWIIAMENINESIMLVSRKIINSSANLVMTTFLVRRQRIRIEESLKPMAKLCLLKKVKYVQVSGGFPNVANFCNVTGKQIRYA